MSVTIQLPEEIEEQLRGKYASLDELAREAVLVDLYRRDEITQAQLGRALGIHRLEVDGVLKDHGVMIELSPDEFGADLESLRGITGR